MARRNSFAGRLYRGEVSFDFVGRQKLWYSISGAILAISVLALLIFGLNFSVDFKGGSQWTVPVPSASQTQLEKIVDSHGGVNASASKVSPFDGKQAFWQVQSNLMPTNKAVAIGTDIANALHVRPATVSTTTVGASWGSQITQKAVEALIAFLIVVVLYLSIAFEWRMAAAAFVALAHDIVITIGVYALTHFQVSPATVIGLLTILGYSLYDTVVVFDKVRENTAPLLGTRRSSYSEAANLALNQTLVRSINTSLIALLPVAAILVVGTLLLGNGELKDLSLVLFVGMLSGTYSSICIATPVLADLKEREPEYKRLAKQVAQRAAGGRGAARRAAKAQTAVAGASSASNGGLANGDTASGDAARTGTTGTGTTGTGNTGAGTGRAGPVQGGAGRAGTGRAGTGRGGAGNGASAAPPDPDVTAAEPADSADDDVTADQVPASQAAVPARSGAPRPPGQRQQPTRRPGSTNRRPSGKKKRR
jgi:preprotein translocase subunit SecF